MISISFICFCTSIFFFFFFFRLFTLNEEPETQAAVDGYGKEFQVAICDIATPFHLTDIESPIQIVAIIWFEDAAAVQKLRWRR